MGSWGWFSYETSDGGENWREVEPEHGCFDAEFFGNGYGVAVDGNGGIYETRDSGNSWQPVFSLEGGYTRDIDFFDEDNWALLVHTGKCAITADGGDTIFLIRGTGAVIHT